MNELVISVAKIGGSLCLLAVVLYTMGAWARRASLRPETSRKLIHLSLGLYCLTFPFLFAQAWEVALTCALAIGVFALARGRLRATLGAGLHAVARRSYGEVYFAVAVAFLFVLRSGSSVASSLGDLLYLLPIAILTVSDAAAALIGVRFGHVRFKVADGTKTCEGVAAFILSAWLLADLGLTAFTELSAIDVMMVSAVVALVSASIEALSGRGLDNLLIPLGVYALLANVVPDGHVNWTTACTLLVGASLTLATIARASRVEVAGAP